MRRGSLCCWEVPAHAHMFVSGRSLRHQFFFPFLGAPWISIPEGPEGGGGGGCRAKQSSAPQWRRTTTTRTANTDTSPTPDAQGGC